MQEEFQPVSVPAKQSMRKGRKPCDPMLGFIRTQIAICIVLLFLSVALRLIGGAAYDALRTQYQTRFGDTTALSLVTKPQEEEPESQTDIIVHTMATVTNTNVPLSRDGGDSPDDSMSVKSEEELLLQVAYHPESSQHAMIPPVNGSVTSPFGYRIHPIYGTRLFHNGVDIGAEAGTPIVASLSGRVIVAEYDSSYGYYLILDHGNDFCTVYAHCSKLLVSVGDLIEQGNTIALVGSTGVSTGPHLHFEVRRGEYRVNPQWLIQLS